MDTTNNVLPFKANEVIGILNTVPDILSRNELSISACQKAGQSLIDTIESTGGINSDEMDDVVQKYLSKTKITVDNMNNRRKPLTQMLTAISKRFTSLENVIDVKSSDTIPYRLQQARNKYAAKKVEEQRRREEEDRLKQLIEKEKETYKSDISLLLDNSYASYIEKKLSAMSDIFNNATLLDYDKVSESIRNTGINFVWSDFVKNITGQVYYTYLTDKDALEIKNFVARQKINEYTKRYSFEMEDLKNSLIDRLPTLKKQLEEQEKLRRTNVEEAAKMEEQRRQRELEERRRLEEERKRKEEEAKAKAEAEKAAAEVQAAFNVNAVNASANQIKAKVMKKIQITNPLGYMVVYQMWFNNEGRFLTMDELEKIHKKMITFCEKTANKDGEQIKSEYVKYVDNVTAK